MFFAPRKPKTTVFTMFRASGTQITGIYNVFVPVPSKKITGIYAVFTMLQDVVSILYAKKTKHCIICILRCFCFPSRAKNRQKMVQKQPKIDFQKHLIILASFLPALKDFGGSAAEARPG